MNHAKYKAAVTQQQAMSQRPVKASLDMLDLSSRHAMSTQLPYRIEQHEHCARTFDGQCAVYQINAVASVSVQRCQVRGLGNHESRRGGQRKILSLWFCSSVYIITVLPVENGSDRWCRGFDSPECLMSLCDYRMEVIVVKRREMARLTCSGSKKERKMRKCKSPAKVKSVQKRNPKMRREMRVAMSSSPFLVRPELWFES